MTKWLVIGNDGEIDPTALRLMASTKQGDTGKIGKFGLGWKQALAALTRLGCDVQIMSGGRPILVGTDKVSLRGQEFDEVVLLDDVGMTRTGVTTALAREWAPWMAIREACANAIDEGGYSVGLRECDPFGEAGRTAAWISATPEILQVWEMWRRYFRIGEAPAAPEGETGHGRLLASLGDGVRIYKQGILVHEDPKRNALWDYDLPGVVLGEDRIAHWWDVVGKAERVLSALPTGLRRRALVEGREFEQAVLGDAWSLDDPAGWADAIPEGAVIVDPQVASHFVEELAGQRLIMVPGNVVKNMNKVREALPEERRPEIRMIEDVLGHRADAGRRPVKATAYERSAIRRAAKAAKWAKLDVDPEAVVLFEGGADGSLGTVDGGKIWVSRECVNRGLREVLKTLIEESAHLESSAPDKSRTMQEALLEIIVRAIEARRRTPL